MTPSPRKSIVGRAWEKLQRLPVSFRLLGMLILAAVLFGLLWFSAAILVVPPSTASADFVFIADFDHGQCYGKATEKWKSGSVEGVLLCADAHRRLVLIGALLPIEELGRQKLLNDGIAPEAIQIMNGIGHSNWQAARILDTWLSEHRDKRVCVLCDLFSSRRWKLVVDRTLAESNRERIVVQGVTDPRYGETNWWRKRTGFKSFFCNLFELAYATFHGEDLIPVVDWSPEKYESAVLRQGR